MIIRSFSIDRFGIFAAQEPVELGPGLNIFLGHNEAGKSTLLNFFRAMFFGYKRDNKNRFDYGASGVTSALSGGSLALRSSQGVDFNLIRRPGAHGGILTLTGNDGRALPESYLAGLLSNQTDKMYDQVFCFGHNDLSSLEEMKDERVAGALHAAAFGTGFKSPLEIAKSLRAEQEKIFAPRASTRPLNQKIKKLGEIQAELAQAGSELSRYNSLKTELEALEKELAELKAEAQSESVELARVHSLAAAWPDWNSLRDIQAELALNPHPGGQFGVESKAHFDEIVAALLSYRADLKGKLEILEKGKDTLSERERYQTLAAIWPDCQNLLARKASVQNSIAALPRLEAALQEAGRHQEKLLQSLGNGWNIEKVLNFEITLALHSAIDFSKQGIETASRSRQQASQEVVRLEAAANEDTQALRALRLAQGQDEAENNGNGVDSAVIQALFTPEARIKLETAGKNLIQGRVAAGETERRVNELAEDEANCLEGVATCQSQFEAARGELSRAETGKPEGKRPPLLRLATAREDTRRVPWLLACVVLAALCFYGVYNFFGTTVLQQSSMQKLASLEAWKEYLAHNWLTFGFGWLSLWGALYWLNPRVATLGRWQPEAPERSYSPAEREAQRRCDAISGQILAAEMQLERAKESLKKARDAARQAAEALARLEEGWNSNLALYSLPHGCQPEEALKIFDATLKAAQSSRKAEDASGLLKQAEVALQAARSGWQDWLGKQGFSPDFMPDTIGGALERIRDIQTQSELGAARKAELEERKEEIQSFRASLAELIERAGQAQQKGAQNGLLARFDDLYKAAFGAHEKMLRFEEQAKELQKLEAELGRLNELAESQEQRFTALLKQGEASDEADYRLRFEQYSRHQALLREEQILLSRLAQSAAQVHAASGEVLWADFAAFKAALAGASSGSLDELALASKSRLEELNAALAEKQNRQGAIETLLAGLTSGEGSAALQARETALREELSALAREWGVLAMAGNFLSQARRSFEEDRHDSVIRQAGEILAGLTGGRYKQMLFDLGGKDFKAFAVNAAGESLDSETALSQGTREQLYLALRLAFIKQHNLSKESLPLIMDDILVNFDPARARNAGELFTAFSAVNQGLFFTCHPNAADLLRGLAPDARFFSINSGKVTAEA